MPEETLKWSSLPAFLWLVECGAGSDRCFLFHFKASDLLTGNEKSTYPVVLSGKRKKVLGTASHIPRN